MRKILYILLILSSCTPDKVQREDLTLKGGLYYKNDKLFTGKVIDRYDNNSISIEINFVNGIPTGKYESFGYAKEVVQEGNYTSIKNPFIQKQLNIIRISKDVFKEGDIVIFHSIALITDQDSTKLNQIDKEHLISLLKPILDNKIKNRIVFTKGELENPTLEFEK